MCPSVLWGSSNPDSPQGLQPPPEEEELLYEPIDTSFDLFIQGGPDTITPMLRPQEEHWDGVQRQVAVKPKTFYGTLSKWKLFKDRILGVDTSQKMVKLLK